jgi:hypothetical protein
VPRVAGQPASAIRDCGIDNPNHGAPGCDGIYRGMQRAKKLAIVGYVAGGLLAAGAVTLFVLAPRERASKFVACAPASKLDGLSCQMRF